MTTLDLEPIDRITIPLPPPLLQHQIFGHPIDLPDFLYGGYSLAEGLRETLALLGRPIGTFTSVLDLGCGCGRILRWLEPESRHARLHGSDISADAIAWNRENIRFAEFTVNGMAPPLAYADGSFDLIIAISLVTHLPEDLHLQWLAEMKRVLRPGGLLLITVAGDNTAALRLEGAELARYREKGHLYRRVEPGGLHGLPDFYQDTYHTRSYVENVWSRTFKLRGYVRHGPFYMQDLVVLEKVADEALGFDPYLWLELPIASLGRPTIGSVVTGPLMPSFGSAFHPRGGIVHVDLWVDGRRIYGLLADVESPVHPAQSFPGWPSTERCAFEAWIRVTHLAKGVHTFKVSGGTNLLASVSSYFFLE